MPPSCCSILTKSSDSLLRMIERPASFVPLASAGHPEPTSSSHRRRTARSFAGLGMPTARRTRWARRWPWMPMKRTEQPAISAAIDCRLASHMTAVPVSAKNIASSEAISLSVAGQILRTYRLDVGALVDIVPQEIAEGVGLRDVLVQKLRVGLLTNAPQQRGNGRLDVANQPQIERRAAANVRGRLSIWTFFTRSPGRNSRRGNLFRAAGRVQPR